ncbi:hypothetical protein MTR67_026188 [Solanum verrucosum]|uniref:Tf2-1-like SH3-like domain-containing protein n=1 Tax=Solanum verrucosum TaxID=315347 RepID=A0AAF0R174_SOLVR|nr:hypothetical protein MTR67_026188 [Solanum verrucosum]
MIDDSSLKDWLVKLDLSTAFHPYIDIQSDQTIQDLENILRACTIDFGVYWDQVIHLVEFSYNNNYHFNIQMALFDASYGRRCRSPVGWFGSFGVQTWGIDLMKDSTDPVLLKVSPTKDMMRIGKKEKLNSRFMGPFEILGKCREVAYRLALLLNLSAVHLMFHLSMLKLYCHNDSHVIQWDSIALDQNLSFKEESNSISDRKIVS